MQDSGSFKSKETGREINRGKKKIDEKSHVTSLGKPKGDEKHVSLSVSKTQKTPKI